ncbi:MAG: hypothetical protein PVI00_02605 [Desulfobacterales bacterium]
MKDIFTKDQGPLFGLKAFKALAGSSAVARLVCQKLGLPLNKVPYAQLESQDVRNRIEQIILTTATDGNYGRAFALG